MNAYVIIFSWQTFIPPRYTKRALDVDTGHIAETSSAIYLPCNSHTIFPAESRR